MAKFRVVAKVTSLVTYEIEVDTEEQAEALQGDTEETASEELDCEVRSVTKISD